MIDFRSKARFLPALLALAAALGLLAPVSALAAPCDGFYASSFALTAGKLNPTMATLAKPARGTQVKEPNFSTCLVRATDWSADGLKRFARNDYSRRQAFNADNTYFITYSDGGVWSLYDASTLKRIRSLTPLAGDAEPEWHPTDPNTLYYLPTSGGTKLLKVDVRNNTSSTVVDFSGKLPSWASKAAHIWTHTEGAPSADGRYWGFIVQDSSWNTLGYIVWDLQQNKLVGSRQDSSSLDNASISAKGRWFVTTGNDVWAWSADFTQKKRIATLGGVHTDLAIGPEGHDYFVSADFQSDNGDIYYVDLDTCPSVAASASTGPLCPRTVLFSMYKDGGWATPHFSAKAFDKPGWLLISMYDAASNSGTLPWFNNKVMAVELKASPKIYVLAYTRRVKVTSGDSDGASNYWAEPQASVNRDFTRIVFNSNWGNSVGADVDTYMIGLPSWALGGTAPPTTSGPKTGGNLPPVKGSNPDGQSVSSSSLAPTVVTSGTATTTTGDVAVAPVFTIGNPALRRLAVLVGYARAAAPLARSSFASAYRIERALLVDLPIATTQAVSSWFEDEDEGTSRNRNTR